MMPNGEIINYEVQYWPTDQPDNVEREIRTDPYQSVSVTDQPGGVEYNFTVRASTSKGYGEATSAVASTLKRLRK